MFPLLVEAYISNVPSDDAPISTEAKPNDAPCSDRTCALYIPENNPMGYFREAGIDVSVCNPDISK